MDQVTQFVTSHKIPVGAAGADAFNWFTATFQPIFDFITNWMGALRDKSTAGLEAIPPLIFILIIAALGYAMQRTWQIVVLVIVCLLFVLNQGLWEATMETTVLVVYATAVSLLIGIPVGIWCARRPRVYVALS